MDEKILALVAVIAPALFALTAILSRFQSGVRPVFVKTLSLWVTVIGMGVAVVSAAIVLDYGMIETGILGFFELGLSLRLDQLSVFMFVMISIIAFIVVKFSVNYLDGDGKQGAFMGRLAATIASVQLLVLSGNLGVLMLSWVFASITLNQLLVFYSNRAEAIIAARKKFIVARAGDVALFASFALLYLQFNTGNLAVIFSSLQNMITLGTSPVSIEIAALLLAVAAMLKSAQFPTHGWLIEVMETPTPVSALLHAGLLNAGPFLIIRMAYLYEATYAASIVLIAVGGFTAIFGSVVFLTQTSVKTALGYSSVAHMGFSLMVSGLGVYPAAMLHLVAHSFYKAHAFLSSGSVIDVIRLNHVVSAKRVGSIWRILLGTAMALSVYAAFAYAWGLDFSTDVALVTVGAVIVLGLSKIFTTAVDSTGSASLLIRASVLATLVTASFFILESTMHAILATELPMNTVLTIPETVLISVILVSFTGVVFLQIATPMLPQRAWYRKWAIHLRNGFYANVLYDRVVRGLYTHSTSNNIALTEGVKKVGAPYSPRFYKEAIA